MNKEQCPICKEPIAVIARSAVCFYICKNNHQWHEDPKKQEKYMLIKQLQKILTD